MKTMMMITIAVLMTMTMAKSDETKTITPQEFASNVAQVQGKLVTFIGNEVNKTKEYQANSWAEMKTKWPFTMFKGKENATQD